MGQLGLLLGDELPRLDLSCLCEMFFLLARTYLHGLRQSCFAASSVGNNAGNAVASSSNYAVNIQIFVVVTILTFASSPITLCCTLSTCYV